MEQKIENCEKNIKKEMYCNNIDCVNCDYVKEIKIKRSIDILVSVNYLKSIKNLREFISFSTWEEFIDNIPEEENKKTFKAAKSISAKEQPRQLARAFTDEMKISSLETVGTYPIFKIILPDGGYVWEMRTKLTRTIGWFVGENKFVAVCGGLVSLFKDENGDSKPDVYKKFRRCTEHVVKCLVQDSDICRFTQIEQILKDVEACL